MAMPVKANLIMINVPSDDVEKSRDFYAQLLGIDLARSLNDTAEGYHAPVSQDGIDINVNARQSSEETPMAYFAVPNLERVLREAEQAGGEVVWGPEKLTIAPGAVDEYKRGVKEEWPELKASGTLGTAAVVVDPGGSQVALVQLAEHAHGHFAEGKFRKPLTEKQERIHKKAMSAGKKVPVRH
jgi:predicted enzyme related to lactoylglutathione lyase